MWGLHWINWCLYFMWNWKNIESCSRWILSNLCRWLQWPCRLFLQLHHKYLRLMFLRLWLMFKRHLLFAVFLWWVYAITESSAQLHPQSSTNDELIWWCRCKWYHYQAESNWLVHLLLWSRFLWELHHYDVWSMLSWLSILQCRHLQIKIHLHIVWLICCVEWNNWGMWLHIPSSGSPICSRKLVGDRHVLTQMELAQCRTITTIGIIRIIAIIITKCDNPSNPNYSSAQPY